MTGRRLRRVPDYVGRETFCMTYGDGVSDVNIRRLLDFHTSSGLSATLTAVRPPGRFGALELGEAKVDGFQEKPVEDGGWINGGLFVLSPAVLDHIASDATVCGAGAARAPRTRGSAWLYGPHEAPGRLVSDVIQSLIEGDRPTAQMALRRATSCTCSMWGGLLPLFWTATSQDLSTSRRAAAGRCGRSSRLSAHSSKRPI